MARPTTGARSRANSCMALDVSIPSGEAQQENAESVRWHALVHSTAPGACVRTGYPACACHPPAPATQPVDNLSFSLSPPVCARPQMQPVEVLGYGHKVCQRCVDTDQHKRSAPGSAGRCCSRNWHALFWRTSGHQIGRSSRVGGGVSAATCNLRSSAPHPTSFPAPSCTLRRPLISEQEMRRKQLERHATDARCMVPWMRPLLLRPRRLPLCMVHDCPNKPPFLHTSGCSNLLPFYIPFHVPHQPLLTIFI